MITATATEEKDVLSNSIEDEFCVMSPGLLAY